MMNAPASSGRVHYGANVSWHPTSPGDYVSIVFARDLPLILRSVSDRYVSSASHPSLVQRGLVSGAVAAAAVLGLLIGIGRRSGTVWRPLNAAAHGLLGAHADDVWSYHGSVTPVGGVVVLVMCMVAGFIVARIASPYRTLHVVAAAAGVALASYLLHLHVVARTPGGLAALLSVGELRGLYLTLGLGLVAGMRFAFSAATSTPERSSASS
jgi:hypothetical protein